MRKTIYITAALVVGVGLSAYVVSFVTGDKSSGVEVTSPDNNSHIQPPLVDSDSSRVDDAQIEPKNSIVSSDPRLAALSVSKDNGFVEFVMGSDGRVIKEIDKNPSSLGFQKPTREYTYAADRVIKLTEYQYFGDYVQVNTTTVSYKQDGSIDEYLESTDYIYSEKRKRS